MTLSSHKDQVNSSQFMSNRLLFFCTFCGWDHFKQQLWCGCSGLRLVRRAWQAWWSSCSSCPRKLCSEGSFPSSGEYTCRKGHIRLSSLCGNEVQYCLCRSKTAALTDNRIRIMNEVVSGMRIIKMYAWEKPFAALVSDVRR